MRFDLVDLQLFVAVAETRSITNGAAKVHLALASASERIKGLEGALGVSLLTRGRRGVELTPAGESLLDHARVVLHNVEAMRGDLLAFAHGVKATVRFLANTSGLSEYLPKTLAAFLAAHPHISIDVEERESSDIARAIVIVPAIVTNIWQTFGGPYLRDIFRRLWPLLTGTAAGIWLNAGSLTGPYARYTTLALGLLLAINAIIGLSKFNFTVARRNEKWVGGIVGLITGMISAATGVQVVPSVPFLQAIGMEKEELIQALGVFFTVATLALGLNLTGTGLLTAATALPGAIAMAASFAGMFIGQTVRTRLQPDIFRRWFQIGMIVLGLYLATNALAKLMSA